MDSINQRRIELGFSAAVAGMLTCWLLLFAAITGESVLWFLAGLFFASTSLILWRMARSDKALASEKKKWDRFIERHPRFWILLGTAGILASVWSLLSFALSILGSISLLLLSLAC